MVKREPSTTAVANRKNENENRRNIIEKVIRVRSDVWITDSII